MQLWIVAWTARQCCFAHFISWYYVCDYHTWIDWCIWSVLVCFISFTAKSIILTTPSSSLKDFYFTGSWPSSRYTKQIAPCFAKTNPRWRTSRQLVPCEVSALSCFHLACVCLPRHWPLWYVCLGGRAERVMWPRTSPVTKAGTAAAQPRSFQMSHRLHEVAALWSSKTARSQKGTNPDWCK